MSCFRAKAPLVFHWFSYNKAQFIAKCDRQLLHIASHGLLKTTTGTVNRLKELCHEIYQNSNSENWGKKAFTLSLNSTRLIWTVSIPRPLPSPPPPASLSVLTGFHCITKRAGFIINCGRCYELWCSPSPPSLRIPIQQSPFLSLSFAIYVPSLKVTQSICICWVEFRLFTVLYFSVRSSRSSALRYGLRHLAWVSKLVRGRGWLPNTRPLGTFENQNGRH